MRKLLICIATCLLPAGTLMAQDVHEGDVELDVIGGRILTDERVYASELGEIVPNESDEPGFDNAPGTFPVDTSVGFEILDALRKWDGTDFDDIAAETMSLGFGTSLSVTTPGSTETVVGFDLPVEDNGEWHEHYDFSLNAPASDGVYLLQMRLTSTASNIAPSLPFFIVFNQNADEAVHDAAIGFMEASVPEPATGVIVLMMLTLGIVRRRRS